MNMPNSAFMGTDEEGLPTPTLLGEDGSCNIPGLLTAASIPAVKKILVNCVPITKPVAHILEVVVIVPISRHITQKNATRRVSTLKATAARTSSARSPLALTC
jgi:hypothetical protein